MPYLKGALIEYGSDFLGPIPNIVIFQFSPESVSRTINIPNRTAADSDTTSCSTCSPSSSETNQAGESPLETINIQAKFSADPMLHENDTLTKAVGIGPQLAALEKMVYPQGELSGAIGAAIDDIGNSISKKSNKKSEQPVPRQQYPRILFIWGLTRILPVCHRIFIF